MAHHPHEVPRDELLAKLGPEASPAKLLRWHHWGFLPQPRRDGHGRNRTGSTSYYPGIAVAQAHVIARVLKVRRDKVEAGWALWALGFREPSTAWVRMVLSEEMTRQEAVLRDRTGRTRELARIAATRGRPVKGTAAMREVLQPTAVAAVVQLLVDIELGTFRPGAYVKLDYEWIRDGTLAELKPNSEDEPSYPGGRELVTEATRIAREAPLGATRKQVEVMTDRWLRIFANEAQILHEFNRRPLTLEETVTLEEVAMSRSFFIGYLRSQVVSPTGREITRKLRKAMGWSKPPRSPLGRAIEELRQEESQSIPTSPRPR